MAGLLDGCSGERPGASPDGRVTFDGTPSLRDVVASDALVGRRVRVSGRCLTPSRGSVLDLRTPVLLVWQLEADGVTVFVAGSPPPECASGKGQQQVTITALVAEDTLPAIGDLPPARRRYLLRTERD